MKYELMGHSIELIFIEKKIGYKIIVPTFYFASNIHFTLIGVDEYIICEDKEISKVIQDIIFNDIIKRIKKEAQKRKLNYIQELRINAHTCWFLDDGNQIYFMKSIEY